MTLGVKSESLLDWETLFGRVRKNTFWKQRYLLKVGRYRPAIMYGVECWALKKKQEHNIDVGEFGEGRYKY